MAVGRRASLRLFPIALLLSLAMLRPSPGLADSPLSFSGRLDLRGVEAAENDSPREDPDLAGRIGIDATGPVWRFHSLCEGGWDGAVRRPPRDASLFKNYDRVYQSNTPFLECKEFFVARTAGPFDLRAGIQRYAWGRLDEYAPNDLLNPWDYTRFLLKPLEDRKIGVPSLATSFAMGDWTIDTVWVPVLVPYRLPLPDERWAGATPASAFLRTPGVAVTLQEPSLPERSAGNGSIGLRISRSGEIDWAWTFFHGWDPRPVFRTTALVIAPGAGGFVVDPGYVPDFHRISVIGLDAATLVGPWSVRVETAYTFHRFFDIRQDLWGYPAVLAPGAYPLHDGEQRHDTLDCGIGADYRLFEDWLLTVQAQQTLLFGNADLLYEGQRSTILWANVKAGFLNRKIEANLQVAANPEHGDRMEKIDLWYVLTDFWKMGMGAAAFDGPASSLFGRYARNDQVEAMVRYAF